MTKEKIVLLALAFGVLALLPLQASAATCDFARDLELGVEGEDVKCLQRYLNATGYTVATEGVGSKGKETTQFKGLTKEAVILWQEAHDLFPAFGYFGPKSRAKYLELGTSSAAPSPAAPPSSNQAEQVKALQEKLKLLNSLKGNTPSGKEDDADKKESDADAKSGNADESSVRDMIEDALEAIEDAEDQIDDTPAAENIASAKDNLEDAKDDLFDAMKAYFAEDFEDALESADDARDNAEDAFEDAGANPRKMKLII